MTHERTKTVREVAARFHELARQEKWFEIRGRLVSCGTHRRFTPLELRKAIAGLLGARGG
jgi:hypothetical protein